LRTLRLEHILFGLICLGAALQCRAGLVEVIAKVKPSVAAVGTLNPLASPRFGFRGTGFVVGDGNLLITNAHVLPEPGSDDSTLRLMLHFPGKPGELDLRPAALIALDRTHDLVLLRFEGSPRPPLPIAADGDIHEGLSIAFIGFPIGGVLGFTPVTHRGILSAITAIALPAATSQQLSDTAIHRLREGSFDIYQLDATAYPGNSGGPVFDAESGQVVGVINMVLVKGSKESALSQPTGISYAIPARFVDALLRRH